MPRHRLLRGLVFATLLLIHVAAWRLASMRHPSPRIEAAKPGLATLRLLPPEPSRLRELPALRRPAAPIRPVPITRPDDTAVTATPPLSASTEAAASEAPATAASSPRPLDLRLRLAPGIAARSDALLAPTGPAGVAVPGGGREINLGDGRRRIFTADGKCFDSYTSRASQLDPFQPGMLRDLKMVKSCE